MRNAIKELAGSFGECDVGFCHAEPFNGMESILQERQAKGLACSFEAAADPMDRIDPRRHLPGAESFIVLAVPYRMEMEARPPDKTAVKMAYGTNMLDYHRIMRPMLDALGRFIEERFGARWQAYCDAGPLSDRAVARRAGLGQIARNSYLAHPRYGLSFFIGYLLTDLVLAEKDQPSETCAYQDLEDLCGSCRRCMAACPNGAILGGGQIDANRCLSYLTQSKHLSPQEEARLEGRLYGCDSCHLACPLHKASEPFLRQLPPREALVPAYVDADWLLGLSGKGFKEAFGPTAAGWRGKKVLQRNGSIEMNRKQQGF